MALTLTSADNQRINELVRGQFLKTVAASRACLAIVDSLPQTWSFDVDEANFDPPPVPEFKSLVGTTVYGFHSFLTARSSMSDPTLADEPFYVTLPTAWWDTSTSTIKVFFNYAIPITAEYFSGAFDP